MKVEYNICDICGKKDNSDYFPLYSDYLIELELCADCYEKSKKIRYKYLRKISNIKEKYRNELTQKLKRSNNMEEDIIKEI